MSNQILSIDAEEAQEVLEKYLQACVAKALQERGLCG